MSEDEEEKRMEFSQKKNSIECLMAREFGDVLGFIARQFGRTQTDG